MDKLRRQWKKKKGKYLFNEFALAKVFRARFLAAPNEAGLPTPRNLPEKWVVDCAHVGKGQPALKYLSRYLYRGVISEHNILSNQDGQVTFKYIESRTGKTRYRTLEGEHFLCWCCNTSCPKAFAASEIMGSYTATPKNFCLWFQLVLQVVIEVRAARQRPVFTCPKCQSPMRIEAISRPAWQSG